MSDIARFEVFGLLHQRNHAGNEVHLPNVDQCPPLLAALAPECAGLRVCGAQR